MMKSKLPDTSVDTPMPGVKEPRKSRLEKAYFRLEKEVIKQNETIKQQRAVIDDLVDALEAPKNHFDGIFLRWIADRLVYNGDSQLQQHVKDIYEMANWLDVRRAAIKKAKGE